MDWTREGLRSLVDMDQGVVSRRLFVDEEIYKRELETVFARGWLFVGHESLIPNPNDYFLSRMGEESVILTRSAQGTIHVLLNTCAHRGMKVCRDDSGNNRNFTCPYHGWSYSTDGRLVSIAGELVNVPGKDKWYRGELDMKKWGLIHVPRLEVYKGTVWASWDADAPDFLEYLGDMRIFLDAALDHRDGRPGGSEVLGGIQKWRVPCNWKFPAENFIGDIAHDISHRSVDMVGIAPSPHWGRRDNEKLAGLVGISFPHLGHGAVTFPPHTDEPEYADEFLNHPEVQEYLREVYESRKARLGNEPRTKMCNATIFPNMAFHGGQPRTIAMLHPVSSTETEIWRMYLVDADAPQAMKDALRRYFMRYSGPGGMTEQDDMENWSYATEASRGTIARRHPYNYQMGLGHSVPYPGLDGAMWYGEYSNDLRANEEQLRALYRRWTQFMADEDWDELMAAERAFKHQRSQVSADA